MTQLELFAPAPRSPEFWWRVCWDWDGPEVGNLCEVGDCVAERADGAGLLYCYMEQCRVLEAMPDDRWLVEIEMHAGWAKNGTRLILGKSEIWPPTRALREAAS